MKRFRRILLKLLYPGIFLTILFVVIAVGFLTFIFMTNRQESLLAYVSYVYSAYALVVLVVGISGIINKIKNIIYNNPYGKRYLSDIEYRSTLSLYQGFFINLLYAGFNFLISWIHASVWFGAIAVYYLSLSAVRILLTKRIHKSTHEVMNEKRLIYELHSYRNCGYLMFLLNIVMAGMVIQMIWQNKGYTYSGYIIYVLAAYTFYCLITAIISLLKYHKKINPILSASKELNLTSALMSILALQTAMLAQFNGDNFTFRQLMNTATGSGILVIEFMMAISMVVRANKKLKILKINNF